MKSAGVSPDTADNKDAIRRFLEGSPGGTGQDAIPATLTSESTLPELFEYGYLPMRLIGKSRKTIRPIRTAVTHWRNFARRHPTTADRHQAVRPVSTASNSEGWPRLGQHVLRRLDGGAAFAANEDSGSLIQKLPRMRKLKEPKRVPLALTVEEFQKVLATAQCWPYTIAGCPASAWWTALLLVAWESGLRYTALLLLRSVDVVWDSAGLICQADTQKDKEAKWFPLPPHVWKRCGPSTIPQRELLFPRDVTIDCVGRWFRKILNASGIYAPEGCCMRFHRIRRSKARYTKALGGDATAALGHSGPAVTERYYDPRIVKPVVQPAMPLPLRFQPTMLPGPVALLAGPEPTAPSMNPEGRRSRERSGIFWRSW